jgi:hypothetical protein
MNDEHLTVPRVQVLHGHTSPDTAYLVEDYPYGRRLRCTIRYWVETATKGAAKGKQRFVSQTTNPRQPGQAWNNPHAATYSALVVLYLDEQKHVQRWESGYFPSPAGDARMRLMGVYDQLADSDRTAYGHLLELSRRPGIGATTWQDWDERIDALAQHIRTTGTDPEVTNGTWEGPTCRYYLGTDIAPYILTARHRAGLMGPAES